MSEAAARTARASARVGKYTSAQQQRLLGLIQALAGHEVNGLAPSQIAAATRCFASQVTRDLDNLRSAGFAEEIRDLGRWRLGPVFVQIALAHTAGIERAKRRLEEIEARFKPVG